MSSFAAASTIPVTNKVAHANSRKSLRIRVITSPMRTAPCTARRARIGRRHDGDTSNLAHNGRRLDWFPTSTLFLEDRCFRYVPTREYSYTSGAVLAPFPMLRGALYPPHPRLIPHIHGGLKARPCTGMQFGFFFRIGFCHGHKTAD